MERRAEQGGVTIERERVSGEERPGTETEGMRGKVKVDEKVNGGSRGED